MNEGLGQCFEGTFEEIKSISFHQAPSFPNPSAYVISKRIVSALIKVGEWAWNRFSDKIMGIPEELSSIKDFFNKPYANEVLNTLTILDICTGGELTIPLFLLSELSWFVEEGMFE